jgi:hypothetical protein
MSALHLCATVWQRGCLSEKTHSKNLMGSNDFGSISPAVSAQGNGSTEFSVG